jgi:cytochrome oxidase Cu insertion factor (SCO1/SenC/PrrC family)
MRLLSFAVLLALAVPPSALAQKGKSDEEFAKSKPAVGDTIPDVTVYDPTGKEVKTSELRGHHTVLTFGCLT